MYEINLRDCSFIAMVHWQSELVKSWRRRLKRFISGNKMTKLEKPQESARKFVIVKKFICIIFLSVS